MNFEDGWRSLPGAGFLFLLDFRLELSGPVGVIWLLSATPSAVEDDLRDISIGHSEAAARTNPGLAICADLFVERRRSTGAGDNTGGCSGTVTFCLFERRGGEFGVSAGKWFEVMAVGPVAFRFREFGSG